MPIKIKYEKLLTKQMEKIVKILKIEALTVKELPDAYIGKAPSCWLVDNGKYSELVSTVSYQIGQKGVLLAVGSFYSQEDFDRICRLIKTCGSNLRDIKQRLEVDAVGWEGKEEIKI